MSYINASGYRILRSHGHPAADKQGRVLEHRKVWFDHHGMIPAGVLVHHENGDRTDNRIENLRLHTRQSHAAHHYPGGAIDDGPAEVATAQCAQCGRTFSRKKHRLAFSDKRGSAYCCSRRCRSLRANAAHHLALKETTDG